MSPRAPDHADNRRALDAKHVATEPSPVILVVEDDTAVRQPLVKFLQMRQYTVVTAETADEGLDAIRRQRPAAAIVDLRLKRGTGREVVVSMPPDVPVIIFSGLRCRIGGPRIRCARSRAWWRSPTRSSC